MQETMKMQSELFFKTMQTLTAGVSNAQVAQPANKLPAQAEKNPKQCGAIETVEAVTTRSGVNTAPVLKTPPKMTYVAPARRTTVQQPLEGASRGLSASPRSYLMPREGFTENTLAPEEAVEQQLKLKIQINQQEIRWKMLRQLTSQMLL